MRGHDRTVDKGRREEERTGQETREGARREEERRNTRGEKRRYCII